MAKQNNNTAAEAVAVLKSKFEAAQTAWDLVKDKEPATAEETEAAQTAFDEAEKALNALTETATAEEKQAAQTAFDEAKEALESIVTVEGKAEAEKAFNEAKEAYEIATNNKLVGNPKPSKTDSEEKLVKGKFLVSPTGRYNLAYNVGEEASLPKLQADELEEAGYFKPNK